MSVIPMKKMHRFVLFFFFIFPSINMFADEGGKSDVPTVALPIVEIIESNPPDVTKPASGSPDKDGSKNFT